MTAIAQSWIGFISAGYLSLKELALNADQPIDPVAMWIDGATDQKRPPSDDSYLIISVAQKAFKQKSSRESVRVSTPRTFAFASLLLTLIYHTPSS